MKIFADLHHQGLYASLHYLFEKRLGHNLYRPVGLEWFDKGFWKIAEPYNNAPDTIAQYLKTGFVPKDGTTPLNDTIGQEIIDHNHGITQKAITLDEFCNMDIDVVIASIPAHVKAYKRLIKEYKPNAKLIYQMGNIFWQNEIPWDDVNNIMASVAPFIVPANANKNVVFYRQEFDTSIFKPSDNVPKTKLITSFVNCLPQPDKYEELKSLLPEFEFRAHGITCPNGIIDNISTIASIMQDSMFGYHNKPHGDGYGHIIHNWMACGRPVIVNLFDYQDKLAGDLLEDGVTCISLNRHDVGEVAKVVKDISSNEDWWLQMCENVKYRFKQVVDFERDARNVEIFLENLL